MSAPARPGDRARAQVLVALPPADTFRLFHEDIDRWWRRGLQYRVSGKGRGILHLEPHVGGRLFESIDRARGAAPAVVQTGTVLVWDPPHRLVFEWRGTNFAPGERTEVEVRFEASPSGTNVTVVHSGWADLRPDHPARHGHDVPAFVGMMGRFWGALLTSLREHAAEPPQGAR